LPFGYTVGMQIPAELLPVFQITLPLLGGMWIAVHSQNKRLDDIVAELREIRKVLKEHGERIARLEERIPPLVHH
jgi:uncharacterized membrane protein YfbV (UPF0208 family)